jgi:negative regulator of sigma-B (phosphoserine phosphatase)
MSKGVPASSPCIDWGVATLALPGQVESGDLPLVKPLPNGVLVAAVDGLGHGAAAAAAARSAVHILERHAHESLLSLVERCHQGLLDTRGVVMSLASFHVPDETMTWLGVGNVEGMLLRADVHARPPREGVLLRGGVVGYQLPALSAAVLPVTRGDLLIFATDGIRSSFAQGPSRSDPPQQLADRILAEHGKGTDDALVLVARYLGGPR